MYILLVLIYQSSSPYTSNVWFANHISLKHTPWLLILLCCSPALTATRMLCSKCKELFEKITPIRYKKSDNRILHKSYKSFYDSVTTGCYICRTVWTNFIQVRLEESIKEGSIEDGIYERIDERLENSAFENYRQFLSLVRTLAPTRMLSIKTLIETLLPMKGTCLTSIPTCAKAADTCCLRWVPRGPCRHNECRCVKF